MLDDDVLKIALITLIPIDGIVVVTGEDAVLDVDIATVKLDAIIRVAMHLNVIYLCTATHGHQRNTVDFITRREFIATFRNHHVAQYTATVIRVIATRKT